MKTLLLIIAILAPLWVFSQNNDPKATPSATPATPTAPAPGGYTILGDTTPSALATKVSQAMRDGWEPTGGVGNSAGGGAFYQAMVKRPPVLGAATEPPAVALRFVTAADAFAAIQQKLGEKAAEAVSGVDEKRNTVALNSDHSQAAIVRAFLTGFDQPPPKGSR